MNQYNFSRRRSSKDSKNRTLTSNRYYAIVNNKHKLVYHRDGHLLIFSRRKDAIAWLRNQKEETGWRTIPVELQLTMIYSG